MKHCFGGQLRIGVGAAAYAPPIPTQEIRFAARGRRTRDLVLRIYVEGSLWANLGAFGSYILPLGLLVAILAGHAIVRRSQPLAVLSALVIHLAVTLGFMLNNGVDDFNDAVLLLRLNAIVAGAFAWSWLLVRRLVLRLEDEAPTGLKALAGFCCISVIALGILGEARPLLIIARAMRILSLSELSLAWMAAALAGSLLWKLRDKRHLISSAFWMLLVLTALLAQTAGALGVSGVYQFRIVLAGNTLAVAALYFLGRWLADRGATPEATADYHEQFEEPQPADGSVHLQYVSQPSALGRGVAGKAADAAVARALRWAIAMAILAGITAIADLPMGIQTPWWTVAALMTLASLAIIVAQRELRPGFLYPATLATCISASVIWAWHLSGSYAPHHLVMLNLIMLGAFGIVSVILEKQVFAPSEGTVISRWVRLHVPASWLCGLVLILAAIAHLLDPGGVSDTRGILLGIAACGTVLSLALARFWDECGPSGLSLLYMTSFASMGMLLAMAQVDRSGLLQQILICSIAMTVLWGILLRRHADIARWLESVGAALPPAEIWPKANAWLGIAGVLLCWLSSDFCPVWNLSFHCRRLR